MKYEDKTFKTIDKNKYKTIIQKSAIFYLDIFNDLIYFLNNDIKEIKNILITLKKVQLFLIFLLIIRNMIH